MSIKFTDVFTKADWIKIIVLVVVAVAAWTWVYIEIQKPIIPVDYKVVEEI